MEMQEFSPPLPVLTRLDRLDRLLQFLEEKHHLSVKNISTTPYVRLMEQENECKTLSSALEEVRQKGTLMERLTLLENRVLQLSLELEVRNTSRSSSPIPGQSDPRSSLSTDTGEDRNLTILALQDKQDPSLTQGSSLTEACERESGGDQKERRRRKWFGTFGWLRMRC